MSERHPWKRLYGLLRTNNIHKFTHKVYSRYHDQRMVSRLTQCLSNLRQYGDNDRGQRLFLLLCRSHWDVENECLEMHCRK